MNSLKKIGIIFLLFISVTIGCKKQDNAAKPKTIRPIRAIVVNSINEGIQRSFSGVARAAVETRLSFRVKGELAKLPVKLGMKLKKGDLIASLDPTDYDLSVKKAQAGYAQAQAQFTRAKADYDRDRQLYEAGNISRSQLDRSLAAYQSAQAQVDAAKKAVQLAKQQLKYTALTAPLDGIVASVPVENHQTIAPGQTIASMTSGQYLEMAVGIPESLIAQINPDDPALISFDAIENKNFKAKVIEVGVEATETTTYPVKLQILETDTRLRPGMVGQVILNFDSGTNFITIPLVSVVTNSERKKYVWIYKPDEKNKNFGTVYKQEIITGVLTSNGIQIIKGLKTGQIIAVRGVHRLAQNMKVKLLKPTDATKSLEAGL